jgi:carboxyl-terminal processing protease
MVRDETVQHLRIFGDVFDLVVDNYVEEVDVQKAMRGAMRGLAEGLDSESAFLTPELVKAMESKDAPAPADIGVDLTRQYYLRVVAAREGSPAAKAGLRTGDYIRAIDGRPTRDMSAFEGARLLRGAVGSKVSLLVIRGNQADPHEIAVVRDASTAPEVSSRMTNATTGYVRIAEFTANTPARVKQSFDALAKTGATRYIIDVRGSARGDLDDGLAAARLFVKSGKLGVRQTKSGKEDIAVHAEDGSIAAAVTLLVDSGTAGAAEVFAAALDGNGRTELIGERTLGRAARHQLVKLPDGSGLLLSATRYLTPSSEPIHDKGLVPDVEVDQPDVDFGGPVPTTDPTLDKALERLAAKQAA